MIRLMFRTFGVLAALACVTGLLALAAETAAFAEGAPSHQFIAAAG